MKFSSTPAPQIYFVDPYNANVAVMNERKRKHYSSIDPTPRSVFPSSTLTFKYPNPNLDPFLSDDDKALLQELVAPEGDLFDPFSKFLPEGDFFSDLSSADESCSSPSISEFNNSFTTLFSDHAFEVPSELSVDVKKPLDSSLQALYSMEPMAIITIEEYNEDKNRFRLVNPLHPEQRKSYRKENRYIAPNPIIIALKDESLPIESGIVSVDLVDEEGYPVEADRNNQKFLEAAFPDGMKLWMDPKEKSVKFCLKVLENSGPSKFRLRFTINYILYGKTEQETVFSNAFIVHYNKKRKGTSPSQ